MSIEKSIKELNLCKKKNPKKQNLNTNEIRQIGRKRKRHVGKRDTVPCISCENKYRVKKVLKYDRKKELMKEVYSYKNKYNNNNILDLLNINKGDLNEQVNIEIQISKIICNNCFANILSKDDYVAKFNNLLFDNEEGINSKINFSTNVENSNSGTGEGENQEMNNSNFNNIYENINLIDFNEYEESFKDIVDYFKKAFFEVSCFVKFYNLYKNAHFINNFDIKIFVQIFNQAKIRFENLFLNGYKIIIKYQSITNKVISKINTMNSSNNNNNNLNITKNIFIEKTNMILTKLSNFFNNFNTLLNFFKCLNGIDYINQ